MPGVVAADPALRMRITGPAPLYSGDSELVNVHARIRPVRVQAVAPSGGVRNVTVRQVGNDEWRGAVRLDTAGRWQIRAFAGTAVAQLPLRVLPLIFPPPKGFGPPGRAGCLPASPRRGAEVFGTARRGQLWGLFGVLSGGAGSTAAVDAVVGKEIKLVFRMTGDGPVDFAAIGPDGGAAEPTFGPTMHESSSWTRPGIEWGVGFVVTQDGCWRLHARMGRTSGDIWLLVRS